jgi:hypothetical protein
MYIPKEVALLIALEGQGQLTVIFHLRVAPYDY